MKGSRRNGQSTRLTGLLASFHFLTFNHGVEIASQWHGLRVAQVGRTSPAPDFSEAFRLTLTLAEASLVMVVEDDHLLNVFVILPVQPVQIGLIVQSEVVKLEAGT
jgi:hypothetical protein